jgi:four helix bundle protein
MENEKQSEVEEAEKPYNIRHRCFHFSKEILRFADECKYDRIHYSIFDQLVRSATSIGANIVEGIGQQQEGFYQFFSY